MFTSPLKRKVIDTNETALLSYFKNQPLIYQLIKKYPNMKRVVYQDAFVLLLDTIISQQISTQAKDHIMQRLEKSFKAITPVTIAVSTTESLRAFGIPKQKANTIINIANDCVEGKLDLDGLKNQSEKEIIETLIAYKGIGIWTCEMMLLFAYEKQMFYPTMTTVFVKDWKYYLILRKLTQYNLMSFQKIYHLMAVS